MNKFIKYSSWISRYNSVVSLCLCIQKAKKLWTPYWATLPKILSVYAPVSLLCVHPASWEQIESYSRWIKINGTFTEYRSIRIFTSYTSHCINIILVKLGHGIFYWFKVEEIKMYKFCKMFRYIIFYPTLFCAHQNI